MALVVPVRSGNQDLRGLIFLGQKNSQQSYDEADIRLLSRIAAVIGQRFALLTEKSLSQAALPGILRECPLCGRCYSNGVERCEFDKQDLRIRHGIPPVIAGRYRLDSVIGAGCMATVYRATDIRLGRIVAIKVAFRGPVTLETGKRFEREGWAGAKLDHPNIVTVYDSGIISSCAFFLVMEFIEGRTWRQELAEKGSMQPASLAHLLDQVLDAVSAAHSAGIVHRDLKPENLLIWRQTTGMGVVKVADFGISKLLDATLTSDLTPMGVIIGTPGYIAPEIYEGRTDTRSDLFSIGVVAWESLTGRRPFRGIGVEEIFLSILNQDCDIGPPDPEWRRLNTVFRKALAKDPNIRFQTAAEMRAELIPALLQCPGLVSASSGGISSGSQQSIG